MKKNNSTNDTNNEDIMESISGMGTSFLDVMTGNIKEVNQARIEEISNRDPRKKKPRNKKTDIKNQLNLF